MIVRYLLGDDIFISYSRKDGKQYATRLKEQLAGVDYSCFIDYEKVYPGERLSAALQRAIRRSRVFILVGTPGARNSEYVRQKIDEFSEERREYLHESENTDVPKVASRCPADNTSGEGTNDGMRPTRR